ncbi:MAG: DUF6531 domain-containing protein, partial [Chloroflexi bacterium]|nr:DUF6531 domain-containing protein [Chloroflexota bacterium]
MKKWLLFPLIVFILTVSNGAGIKLSYAQTGEACPDIGMILDLPASPGEIIRGGGILTPGQVVTAEITADDAGDRWVIPAVSGAGQLNIHVTGNDIPLLVTLLRGFEEIRTASVQVGGTSVAVTIPAHGYYTLVVRRESVIDTQVTGSYSLSVEGAIAQVIDGSEAEGAANYITYLHPVGGSDGTIRVHYEGTSTATINVSNNSGEIFNQRVEGLTDIEIESSGYYAFRVDTTGTHSISLTTVDITGQGNISIQPFFQPNLTNTQIEAPTLEDGLLTIFPGDDITIQTYVDAVRDIAVGGAIRLLFANPALDVNGGSLSFARNELESVTILENGVTVTRTTDRQLYIGSFDVRSQLANDNGFQNLVLPDGRSVTQASWNVLDRVVLLEDCVGADFETGLTFIGEGVDYSLGGTDTESGNQIVTAESEAISYRANVEMNMVARLEARDGRLNIDLVDGHVLSVDRPNINLTTTESGLLRVNDNINDARLVLTDWEQLDSITVNGIEVMLETTDLRGTVVRDGRELREFEARDGVFNMVWADGSSTRLLNESNDFILIESPAELPVYDPDAGPGEVGYIPSNMNNVGQECSPVNTAFQFNCTDNGLANPVNGNLSMTVTDIFARGYRLDLQHTRTYNSANADINGPFGLGWDTNILPEIFAPFDVEQSARIPAMNFENALDLSLAPLGQITLRTASGSRHVFTQGATRWTSLNLPGWSAEIREDDLLSPWRILSSEGIVYEYDIAGRLRGIRHVDSGHIEIEREGQWFNRTEDDAPLYAITDDTGRAIRLEFDNNAHVVRAELVVDGEVWDWAAFTYNEDLLVGVTHQDGAESTYEYDANNRLVHHIDEHAPLAPELYYAYNPAGKLCNIALTRPNCEAGEASYRTYRYDEGSTRVRDEWGHVQTWNYVIGETPDSSYLLTAIEPDGMTDIEYASNNVVDSFSRNGVVHNLLNTGGNFTQLTSEEWTGFVAEYTDMAVDVDGDGNVDDYSIKRLISYDIDPGSPVVPLTTYEYNDSGQLIEVNHEGVTTVIEYDNRWSLPSTIVTSQGDEPGQTILFTYDNYGFVQQRVDADGTHNFTWNLLGQLLEYSLVAGSETFLTYTVSYEDECTLLEDHLASRYTFCYNHAGQIVGETVEAGDYLSETNYTYDPLRRISTIEQYVDEDTIYLTTYEYDGVRGAGNWNVRITNPDGVQHVTQYDWQGNVVGKIDPAGRSTVYEYGERAENGSVTTTAVFPNGNERQYLYNRIGQLCSVTQGETVWQFVYDTPNCLISSSRLPSQLILSEEVTIRFEEYDSAGRPTRIEYFVRRPSADDPDVRELSNGNDPGIVFEYEYDASGRLLSIVNEETGASRTINYVQADGITEIVEQVGEVITRYQFDPLGRLILKENDAGSATYAYTAEGQTVRVEASFASDDRTNNWQLEYNAVGQLVEWIDEDNIPTRYTYDGLGRLITIERNDEVIGIYQYDASNHV